jgi:hypothetical protein
MFIGDVTGLRLISDVIGCYTFTFCFGDAIGLEQVW